MRKFIDTFVFVFKNIRKIIYVCICKKASYLFIYIFNLTYQDYPLISEKQLKGHEFIKPQIIFFLSLYSSGITF